MISAQIADAARHHWWLFLLRGIMAIVFGLLALSAPGVTLVLLMALIATYALVDGLVAIVYAFRLRPVFDRWWLLLVQGLISCTFGVLAFRNPRLSLTFIVVWVALWMLTAAIAEFMLARAQREMGSSSGWSVLAGILTVALAVAAIMYPGLTVATIIALIAWFALAFGVVELVVAFRVRSFGKRLAAA